MKKKHIELLKYLSSQNRPITSNELSNALNISVRSAKQYIREINETYNKKIVLPSHSGYEINPKTKSIITFNIHEEIPQTTEERVFYIIKQLMLNHTSKLELFDLCDFLCISYSTIKSVISKMNKMFSSYHIEFICKNDHVFIQGSELNKRKLISYILNEEAKNSCININLLKENFSAIDVGALYEIIIDSFKKNNYYINDFAAINLLLHLLIIIDREMNGNELDSGQSSFDIESPQEKQFLYYLLEKIESCFHVQFNEYERFEIYMLFKANTSLYMDTSNGDLEKIVGLDIINLVHEYTRKINSLYMIDLSNSTFTTPFALHLKNLIFRATSGHFAHNPMTEAIKNNSPVVFDIAIYLYLDLMDRYNFTINEGEVAFLAMHIGAEMERQTINKYKIPTVLVCPNYHDMATILLNTLMLNFGNQLNLISSVTNEYELEKLVEEKKIAMIFTTIPLSQHYKEMVIFNLSPINISSQFEAIQASITNAMESYKDKILRVNFHNFFEKELFIVNPTLQTKQQVLTFLCDTLLVKNYVNPDFEEKVYRRENAATTAFEYIAIPHSVEMDAIKTSIAVAISKKGIQWDTNTVHIVLLLAINKADQQTFRSLYESLISLFREKNIIQEIRNCTTFQEFEHLIYSLFLHHDRLQLD